MKSKNTILIVILYIFISACSDNSCSFQKKDANKFIGKYQITEILYVEYFNHTDTLHYTLNIQETNQCGYDLEFTSTNGNLANVLGANIIDDYNLKFDQKKEDKANNYNWSISGSKITINPYNDSIAIEYSVKTSITEGIARCKGVGIKVK